MNRDGFSLLELLVVTAVIALLSSVILPALQLTRGQSKDLVCAANIHQLNAAALIYAQEDKTFPQGFCGLPGYYNPPNGIQGHASFDSVGWWWFDFLSGTIAPDASRGGTLWCPSRKISRGYDTDHVLCGNYGINTSICRIASPTTQSEFIGTPLKSANLSSPASTILLTDSGYSLISWKSLSPNPALYPFECALRQNTYYLPGAEVNRSRDIHPDHLSDALEGRHLKNRVNVGYADGRVEKTSPYALNPDFDEQNVPRSYSNWLGVKNR